jgi:hypothetical protein
VYKVDDLLYIISELILSPIILTKEISKLFHRGCTITI